MRALARIDAGAIARNTARLTRAADGAAVCAVVKSGGYGHGAVPAARAALEGGATWLAVAAAQEARELRAAGIDARLLVMGALDDEELAVALEADADVVAWTDEFLAALPSRARVHVKLDSGMGRLGTRDPVLATRLADAAGDRLAGLMTHFATADEPGDAFMGEQLGRFREWVTPLRERFPDAVVHAANSAATLRDRATHFDMVRPGVAIYGLDPFGADPAARELEPALALVTKVLAVKSAAPGESAGYGRRFVAREQTELATLPIGYGDGWRRALTNNADVLIGGRRFPLVGTVSMDNITVELGLDSGVQVGDEAVLIGAQGPERILAEEVARRLDTINYEVTCGLTPRVVRGYPRDRFADTGGRP
jgi:alanine racemase